MHPSRNHKRLNEIIVRAMKSDEAEKQFGSQGWTPVAGSPEDLAKFQAIEIDRWARLVKAAGIQPT